jgi:hypothetical protein
VLFDYFCFLEEVAGDSNCTGWRAIDGGSPFRDTGEQISTQPDNNNISGKFCVKFDLGSTLRVFSERSRASVVGSIARRYCMICRMIYERIVNQSIIKDSVETVFRDM